ncbi:K(+)-transporting ATPase subunit F [Azorhizobium doebereinerae]|uniref:K(+)-transporting ATPase subunit F n=1 Tax=Azorhizobium doebereinerae TaxID=281091 RepID=UPI000A06C214
MPEPAGRLARRRVPYGFFTGRPRFPHLMLTGPGGSFRTSKEVSHGRRPLSSHRSRLLRPHGALHPLGGAGLKERPMFDLILGAAVTLGLAAYLLAALVRPERF